MLLTQASSTLRGVAALDDLERRAFRFFWEQSHPVTGITKDRAANFVDHDDYEVGSIASIGFALTAYPIGVERKWASREDARRRTIKTLKTINDGIEHQHGWLYHFIDWRTGKRLWKCEASTIDTAILVAGVLVADRYWRNKDISELANRFLKRIDWEWAMRDGGAKPTETTFVMGWKDEEGFLGGRWENFDELKMIYVMGLGATDLPVDGWSKVKRVPVSYAGYDLIRGGPLFIHQMSESFFSFKGVRDPLGYDYSIETRNATLANRRYCLDNPAKRVGYGPGCWGLSACDAPDGYNAFGAPGWVNDDGTVTPTSAIASLPFTPKESLEAAESMLRDHADAYGRYGFSNGVNPTRKWKGPDVIGIDLGMMMCGIENYRTGLVNRLAMSHPIAVRGFQRIGFKKSSSRDERLVLPKPQK